MAEPPELKKIRRESTHKNDIFGKFKQDEGLMKRFKRVYDALILGFNRFRCRMLKIDNIDARSTKRPVSFSHASVGTSVHTAKQPGSKKGTRKPAVYSFGSIFQNGTEILKRYITEEELCIPSKGATRTALRSLLLFITNDLDSLKPHTKESESAWAVLLVQHLLSKLAVGKRATLDKRYSEGPIKQGEGYVCPCDKREKFEGEFGDTSFGCARAWHGSVDIYMEDIPVTVKVGDGPDVQQRERLSSASSEDESDSAVEVKTGDETSQMLAQTIVCSFLQRKQNGEALEQTLIPSIAFNGKDVVVHLYDCEHDVLLQSCPGPLFDDDGNSELSLHAVILLWLTLNYQCFCTGVLTSMKEYQANFFDLVGDSLQVYQNEVQKPCTGLLKESDWLEDFVLLDDGQNNRNQKIKFEYPDRVTTEATESEVESQGSVSTKPDLF